MKLSWGITELKYSPAAYQQSLLFTLKQDVLLRFYRYKAKVFAQSTPELQKKQTKLTMHVKSLIY